MPRRQTRESVQSFEGGDQTLGFGWYAGVAYNEARQWVSEGRASMNGLLESCGDMMQEPVLNFMNWAHRRKQAQ